MKAVIGVIVAGFLATSASALTQEVSPKSTTAGDGVAIIGGDPGRDVSKAVSGTTSPDDLIERIRRNTSDQRLPDRSAGAPTPFAYTPATEPPREAYRRPVPCSSFARETDGSTTCIGIDDRPSERPRIAAKPSSRMRPSIQAEKRRQPLPRRREVAVTRLTDPRFDPPSDTFAVRSVGRSGLLSFLAGVLSR